MEEHIVLREIELKMPEIRWRFKVEHYLPLDVRKVAVSRAAA